MLKNELMLDVLAAVLTKTTVDESILPQLLEEYVSLQGNVSSQGSIDTTCVGGYWVPGYVADKINACLEKGEYIGAIKHIRAACGLPLKDAKEAIDCVLNSQGLTRHDIHARSEPNDPPF